MNTTQLECFVQVAQNLSFRRAAEELHISQPTVSKQVASLEDELGGTLFLRTTRESGRIAMLAVPALPSATPTHASSCVLRQCSTGYASSTKAST